MKHFLSIWLWGCLLLPSVWVACSRHPSESVRMAVDSLNSLSYACRYRQLDKARDVALQAWQQAGSYRDGRAEALNNLGFCSFMLMDFEQAERYYRQVYGATRNELELLVADIGLMKLCQRTALNKEFYDYRNAALRRMRRIAEDQGLFADGRRRRRLLYARSEFHIVSSIYYYYLQQRPEAVECVRRAEELEGLEGDTAQWLYCHYIGSTAGLAEGDTVEWRLQAFDDLCRVRRYAAEGGYLYFEANSLQGLANLMIPPEGYGYFLRHRPHALTQLGVEADSLLPLRLAEVSLDMFHRYGDLYQIASDYVTIARYHNLHGDYQTALDTLTRALECVNVHHRMAYDCRDSLDWLQPFGYMATTSVEKSWMQQKLRTVPEWISRIREQLSVAYAGLGVKEASDYNRNIYLDILDETRQDKELESRYEALEGEVSQLNWLLLTVGIVLGVVLLFFGVLNRLAKARNRKHLLRLHLLLDICQQITASIPADAQSEEEVVEALRQRVWPSLEQLFHRRDIRLEGSTLVFSGRLRREEKAILLLIEPYIRWAIENGRASISLGETQQRLEEQRQVHERHIAENKRQNVVKKACLALVDGIRPYIDRIIHEVDRLRRVPLPEAQRKEKYQYIEELVETINEYNDILALWIKMRQGTLSLNIETFALNQLFDLIRKGEKAFEMKQIRLEVESTDAFVKADKSLTIFMINTLADNARKYTNAGGRVRIYARRATEYVEISVEDDGCGLSPEDVARIEDEKVYDPRTIGTGVSGDKRKKLLSKGSGFGLMNCRGIIEKYRKTGDFFRVCTFRVESRLGEGSRFYFRLPVGVRRMVRLVIGLVGPAAALLACTSSLPSDHALPMVAVADTAVVRTEAELLLDAASDYADSVYYCNIDRDYTRAVSYADSAIALLNRHYRQYAPSPGRVMTLTGRGTPAEIAWWNMPFDSDFHVILDIRNELAVAFLALRQWDAYQYNNEAYTALYKLLGEDKSLEAYCRQLEESANNKMVALLLGVVLLLSLPGGYYFLYERRRMNERWKLEQVLETNRSLFRAVSNFDTNAGEEGEAPFRDIVRRAVDAAFESVCELTDAESLTLALYDDTSRRLVSATHALTGVTDDEEAPLQALLQRCWSSGECCRSAAGEAWPLLVEAKGTSLCIGVWSVRMADGRRSGDDGLLHELVARYVAIVIFNAVFKLMAKCRDIELAQDETRRAQREDSQLHVQNLVLDNCLSTIKHETLYYPNKIRQLIGRLCQPGLTLDEEREMLSSVGELIEYYKGIYTLLSQCASRQLEEITFRRARIPVAELFRQAEGHFRRMVRGRNVELRVTPSDLQLVGDAVQLRFLLENLLGEALSAPVEGVLELSACREGEFVRIDFTDRRRDYPREVLNLLFSPSKERMRCDEQGVLRGTEYLVCKQIIRDHDEYVGRRGCRIQADPAEGGGFTVSFTIPYRRGWQADVS